MTKTDKLIFWVVLVGSVLMLLFSNVIFAKSGDKTVIIEADGKLFASYSLENIVKPKCITVQTQYGVQEIEITNEKVHIVKSDCRDGLCLGEIENPGEMLVCLPNRIVVRMESSGEVDGVAY